MIFSQVKKTYRWIQAMSLDVVLGSGLLSLAIAKYYQVNLPLSVVAGLMIAVWTIYTFDHLSDAGKIAKAASTYRHLFHQRHYRILWFSLQVAVLAGLALAWIIPPVVLGWSLICAALVASYFLLLKLFQAFWYKELLVAGCYTIGVFLGPLSLSSPGMLNFFQLLLIPQIFLLALANLVIFSCFDYSSDQQDGHYSLALHFGLSPCRKLALALVVGGFVLSGLLFFLAQLGITREVQLLMMAMNLLLLTLLLKEKRFRRHNLFRIIGDGIFLIPALFLLHAK